MVKDINGFIACVTGGARGLGASIVRQLAENGAHVVIADVLATEGDALGFRIKQRWL